MPWDLRYPFRLYTGEPGLSPVSPLSVTWVQPAAGSAGTPLLPSACQAGLVPGGAFGDAALGGVPLPWSGASRSHTPAEGRLHSKVCPCKLWGWAAAWPAPASRHEEFGNKGFTFGFLPSLQDKLQAVSLLGVPLCLTAQLRNIPPRAGCAGISSSVPSVCSLK